MNLSSGSGHARRVVGLAVGAAALLAICATLVTGSALAAVGGEYTINGLPTGEYKLQFEGAAVGNYLPQYYPGKANFGEATALALAAPAQVSGVNASLLPGGQINGKVTSAEGGAPIAGIFVCATGEGLPEECAETNAAGEYTIVALQTGAYIVTFFGIEGAYLTQYYNAQFSETKAESVTVNEGTTTFGIDAVMQTPATDTHGKITGKVVEAGAETPLEGVEACAFAEIEETEEEVERCAITPASGEYTLAGLPSGKYEVFFLDQQNGFQPQLYKEKSFSETPTFVKVEVGHTKPEINAKLKKGATISGTVMSAAGEKPI